MLKFDADKELYTYNDIRIPRVSELLPKGKFYVSDERLEETRIEGQDNHGAIKMYNDTKGETFGNPLVEAYDAWVKENKSCLGELVCYEKPMYSKIGFAGRPDLVFDKAIVDLKRSRGNSKINALQMAGYFLLVKENYKLNIKKWIMIYYDGGVIKQYNVFNIMAVDVFRSLVVKYQIEQQLKNYLGA